MNFERKNEVADWENSLKLKKQTLRGLILKNKTGCRKRVGYKKTKT